MLNKEGDNYYAGIPNLDIFVWIKFC